MWHGIRILKRGATPRPCPECGSLRTGEKPRLLGAYETRRRPTRKRLYRCQSCGCEWAEREVWR